MAPAQYWHLKKGKIVGYLLLGLDSESVFLCLVSGSLILTFLFLPLSGSDFELKKYYLE